MTMKKKKTIEDGINEFLTIWGYEQMASFLRDIVHLFKLYDVEDENDWVNQEVGEENATDIRLIRTVYLISRIADFHAGTLCTLKIKYKELWNRMEKEAQI